MSVPTYLFTWLFTATLSARAPNIERLTLKLQPHPEALDVHEFARTVSFWASWFDCDPYLSVAIAMQESSLRPNAVSVTGDVGLFQFSPHTITAYNIDKKRLLTDLDYQVMWHFKLLAEKKATCRGKRPWSCYHSSTPELRKKYEKDVLRFYKI